MRRGTTIIFFSGLFFVFAIILASYVLISTYRTETGNKKNGGVITTLDPLPEGISVIERNGAKVLKDERVGYEMEIPEEVNAIVGRDNTILFYSDMSVPDYGSAIGGIGIFDRDNLSLEEWVARLHAEKFLVFFEERERIDKGDLEILKIKMDGPGEPYDYFFLHKDKVINISWVAGDYLDKYIQNIIFMNQ